jgi:hypothetical protein
VSDLRAPFPWFGYLAGDSSSITPHIFPVALALFVCVASGYSHLVVAFLTLALPSVAAALVKVEVIERFVYLTFSAFLPARRATAKAIPNVFLVSVPAKIIQTVIRRGGIGKVARLVPGRAWANEGLQYKRVYLASDNHSIEIEGDLNITARIGGCFHQARRRCSTSASVVAAFSPSSPDGSIIASKVVRKARNRKNRSYAHAFILHIPTVNIND